MKLTRCVINIAVLAGVVLAMAACAPQTIRPVPVTVLAPSDTVSAYQFAGRLGMKVERADGDQALLSNSANSLLINVRPGVVYLNGQAVPTDAGIYDIDGLVFVSASLAEDVRPVLRPTVEVANLGNIPQRTRGIVVIDAGHGGRDPGAPGVGVYCEKQINLMVARKVAARLKASNVTVLLTRDDDTFIELEDRPAVGNRVGADLFVSLHSDSAQNRQVRGFTIYISRTPSWDCQRLGNALAAQLEAAGIESRGVKEQDFRVLVHSEAPAALVEMGFLSNRQDAAALAEPLYQDRLAKAITASILSQLPPVLGEMD